MMASLHLAFESALFDACEALMLKHGKTVEQGIRDFLATLLLPNETARKEANRR